jgi:serine/threonine protein kinase
MGEVYRARDSQLGRDVAIKVLVNLTSAPDRLRRFEQEARAAAALNHPNILAVYYLGIHDGAPYLVSELLDGETLREQIKRGRLPIRKAIDYGAQIARGLAAAHEKGIVHRDLKPENLFVTKDGRIKILDFGLAKLTQPWENCELGVATLTLGTEPGLVLGTVGYMSPEQVRGQTTDIRTDIFAFGAILYEVVSGKRAFQGASGVETMNAILREDPPELAENGVQPNPGWERIVRRCLEKSPERSFQSASDLGFAIESLSETSGANATSSPQNSPSRKWLLPLVAALAVLALGAISRSFLGAGGGALTVYQQLTFKRGIIYSAKFAPDGKTVVYSASWDGQAPQIYSTQPDSPESRALDLKNSNLLAVSASRELAISLGCSYLYTGDCGGILARVPLSGGAPREVVANVSSADWKADGNELAVTRQVHGRYRVEFPVGKVLYESPGGWVRSVRISPKGDAVAFVEHPMGGSEDTGIVMVFDQSGRQRVRSVYYWSVEGLAWSPRGDEVWFAGSNIQQFADEIHALNLGGKDRIIMRLPGIIRLHDVSNEGHLLITREVWRGTLLFRGPGDQTERDLSWLDYPTVTDISPDGKTISFSEEGEAARNTFNAYIRSTDDSPAVKFGNWGRPVLSPDRKWLLGVNRPGDSDRLVLCPTGPGNCRTLDPDRIQRFTSPGWIPDGANVIFGGNQGQGWNVYVQDLVGGKPHAVTPSVLLDPERFQAHLLSPDGKRVFARDLEGKAWLYSLAGENPRAVPGIERDDDWIGWSDDQSAGYVFHWDEIPARLFRLDLSSGKKRLVAELKRKDPIGVSVILSATITPDGRAYAYTCEQIVSELFLVTGVK